MSNPSADDPPRATVLVVDDTKENLQVIGQLLRPLYHVRVANSGARALQVADSTPLPDLILLDVMMPELDGYAVIRALHDNPRTRSIPVIFVTALDADQDEERGLSLGAVDYVTKPVKPALLLARVKAHLELKRSRDWLADQNAYLDAEVQRRMAQNEQIKNLTLHAMATLAEKRDNETGNHLFRTRGYIEALMATLQTHPRFAAQLSDPQLRQRIARAAPLHDIGKVGIPDAILLKPGKLTPDEFEVMKTHASIGSEAIAEIIASADALQGASADGEAGVSPVAFLEVAQEIAGGHHEKWDGSGYPLGLQGDAIPLSARLMALADVFDALISRRHYKEAFPIERAVAIISEGRGRHFDPDIVDAFLGMTDQFIDIAQRYGDPAPAGDH